MHAHTHGCTHAHMHACTHNLPRGPSRSLKTRSDLLLISKTMTQKEELSECLFCSPCQTCPTFSQPVEGTSLLPSWDLVLPKYGRYQYDDTFHTYILSLLG